MSVQTLSLFVILILCTEVTVKAQAPETAFPFDANSGYGNTYTSRIPAALVPVIVRALSDRHRDARLSRLLPKDLTRTIDGEAWFDLRGITVRKQWVGGSPLNLKRIVLDYAHFDNVNISGIDCIGCILRGVVFLGGQLKGADFRNASLDDSRFIETDLEGARFQAASFGESVQFVGCKLNYSRFDSYVGRVPVCQYVVAKCCFRTFPHGEINVLNC